MAYPGNVIAKMTYLDALLEGFPVHRAFGSPSRGHLSYRMQEPSAQTAWRRAILAAFGC
jgi:hypothetical protein